MSALRWQLGWHIGGQTGRGYTLYSREVSEHLSVFVQVCWGKGVFVRREESGKCVRRFSPIFKLNLKGKICDISA